MPTVTTWYLEMRDRGALRRPTLPRDPAVELRRVQTPSPAFSRFLYTAVGGDWYWRDRLSWSPARWLQQLARDDHRSFVLWHGGNPAGYVELERAGGDVEIGYFGLLPEFIGRGLGGHLLADGIDQAWDFRARRVWVHTCSLDGPAALANYEARGMHRYREERREVADLGAPDGPWPGAGA